MRLILTFAAVLAGVAAAGRAPAGEVAAVTVLDTDSYLRTYFVFQTPVVMTADGKTKTPAEPSKDKEAKPIAEFQSALPPAEWAKPDFDDSAWKRQRAPAEVGTKINARYWSTGNSVICVRGKFTVEDPGRVQGLKLSLEYVGGAVVYLNGQELTRASLPTGALKPETLAEKYPDDLYCATGVFLRPEDVGKIPGSAADFERRYRKLADVAIPSAQLRKGTNVLAIEIHRAPMAEPITQAKFNAASNVGCSGCYPGVWPYAGLRSLALTAAAGSAVAPNLGRPKGVQVWNCAPFDTISAFDFSDGGELLPVGVTAPRGGVFSGRLVVSSDGPIKGLKIQVSDLAGEGGAKLPASAVRVRCAESGSVPGKTWAPASRFDGLLDALPAEVPVIKADAPAEFYPICYGAWGELGGLARIVRKGQGPGAVAPIWLTVRVPRDAKAGKYAGTVTVSAEGLKPTEVPLRVTVTPWAIPEPKDFRVANFAYLSEDSIARHYNVPPWSDKHFELMGKSMALMAEINSRPAVANLAINFYGGNKGGADCSNEQSLVRWIREPDGSFKHDFTVFDKYLDFVARTIGKPTLLRVNCWGEVMLKDGKLVPGSGVDPNAKPLAVTVLDPATGKLDTMEQPLPGTEESYKFWKPVLDEVRKKIEARGWWDVTVMGHSSYCWLPRPEVVSVCKRIWPDAAWAYTAHNGTLGMNLPTTDKAVTMPVRYADSVWTKGPTLARGYRALFKPRPGFNCYTYRTRFREWSELTILRDINEEEIMSGHDGVSDFGADLFPVKMGSDRRYYTLGNGRGTGGPNDSTRMMLYPGPDGAVATERFEMLREGTELAEAILFIERALQEKKISGDLETRANRCLDERAENFLRGWADGRFGRDEKLLALAGEVAAAVGK